MPARWATSHVTDNVITHRRAKEGHQTGLRDWRADRGELSTLLDNIVAHIAASERSRRNNRRAKEKGSAPLTIDKEAGYNEYHRHNWDGLRYLSNPDVLPRDEKQPRSR